VQEVLVDRRQLAGELLVEQVDDLSLTAHRNPSSSPVMVGGPFGRSPEDATPNQGNTVL
jgi:hypothetical protein